MDSRISVKVHIRKNDTGEVRIYNDYLYVVDENNEPIVFMWEDGNYSCDCNRQLFFARVNGEHEDWGSACSRTRYSVNIESSTGKILYSEF